MPSCDALALTAASVRPSFKPITRVGVFRFASLCSVAISPAFQDLPALRLYLAIPFFPPCCTSTTRVWTSSAFRTWWQAIVTIIQRYVRAALGAAIGSFSWLFTDVVHSTFTPFATPNEISDKALQLHPAGCE